MSPDPTIDRNGDGEANGDDQPLPKAHEVLAQLADEQLIARVERRRTDRLTRDHRLPSYLRETKTHLEPADWRVGYLAVRDREIPDQLLADLREVTPQALLRDLYRPVRARVPILLEPHEGVLLDPGGRQAMALAKEARQRTPIPAIEPLAKVVTKEAARLRAHLAEPWKPAMPDDAERRSVDVARDTSRW